MRHGHHFHFPFAHSALYNLTGKNWRTNSNLTRFRILPTVSPALRFTNKLYTHPPFHYFSANFVWFHWRRFGLLYVFQIIQINAKSSRVCAQHIMNLGKSCLYAIHSGFNTIRVKPAIEALLPMLFLPAAHWARFLLACYPEPTTILPCRHIKCFPFWVFDNHTVHFISKFHLI